MKKIMQILPSLDNTGGGVERGTLDIAKEISERGYKSLMVSSGGDMSEKYKHKGVIHINLALTKKTIFSFFKSRHNFKKILKEFSPDLIHIRSRWPAFCLRKIIEQNNIPWISTYHGTYSGNEKYFKKKYNEFMVKGKKVIAISEFIFEHIISNFPNAKNKIHLINRGIDLDYFDVKKVTEYRKEKFLKQFGISENNHIILLPGRLTSWKGHFVALKAAKILKDCHPHFNFLILFVGSEQTKKSYVKGLKKVIKKYNLENNIIFTGPIGDMPAVYSMSDVVISTSTEPEAFGRVSAEASSMMKPVIASNHGGSKDILINNVTGWLIEKNNPKTLADKIFHVINMPESQKDHMGKKARERIRVHFNLKQMLDKTISLYENVIGEKKENFNN